MSEPIGEPVFVRVRPGQSVRTEEVVPGEVLVDYGADGQVVGVEVLNASARGRTERSWVSGTT